MKIQCEHCHKTLQNEVTKQMGNMMIGHVQCQNCNTIQNRFLTFFDITMNMAFTSLLFSMGLYLVVTLMNVYGRNGFVIMTTLGIVSIMAYFIRLFSLFIYDSAPFKKEWKHYDFKEDPDQVMKKSKLESWAYMLVAFVFATQKNLLFFYPLIVLFYHLFILIQLFILHRNEKQIYKRQAS